MARPPDGGSGGSDTDGEATARTPPAECPICDAPVADDAPTFPFCSPRCKAVDLHQWLSGGYDMTGAGGGDEDDDEGEGEGGGWGARAGEEDE